jgi:uroporphyrin-III C-methyltransferase
VNAETPPPAIAGPPAESPPVPPAPAPAPPPIPAARDPRLAWAATAVALLLAIGGLGVGWRADQRLGTLEQELVRRQQDSANQASEARMLAKQAEEGMRSAAAKVALLEARVTEVAIQRTQFEELIQSLARSRDENLIVDIEASLRVALQQSALTGSAEPLVATLRQSDERLARYNQPRLEGVRRAIARDLDKVRATGVTDIAVLTIKLDESIRLVDELPLLATAEGRADLRRAPRAAATTASAASAPASAAAAWTARAQATWSAWWGSVQDEVRSLVRVHRIDAPEALLLQPEHGLFLRENLKLRLLNARLALLSRQFAVAQADLVVAQAAIDRYFDRSARRTQAAAELVRQVAAQSRQVVLPRPDDTLAALAAVAAGR